MSKFVILHKKKDTLNRLCCVMKVMKQTSTNGNSIDICTNVQWTARILIRS